MTTIYLTLIVSHIFALCVFAQERFSTYASSPASASASLWSEDSQADAAYELYRVGYNYILDERWKEARKIFTELISRFPKSEYLDEAMYWSAYALSNSDRQKGIEAYKAFIDEYSTSSYYDDAVADLQRLKEDITLTTAGDHHAVVSVTPGKGYSYAIAPTMRQAERQLRRTQRKLNMLNLPLLAFAPLAPLPGHGVESRSLDPETRLKMDALAAIGDTKEDSISFKTLRDVALDRKQPPELRETAMDVLANFRKFEVLPIYLEIAKQDTSEEMQAQAIDYMGQVSHGKNKSVESLTELFNAIPPYRNEQRLMILNAIGEIGNDKAVDVLAKIARTKGEYDLRSEAVFFLGNIGSDKARVALYDILRGK